jgi:hypothetical protein
VKLEITAAVGSIATEQVGMLFAVIADLNFVSEMLLDARGSHIECI